MIDDVDPEYKGPVKPRFRERFTGWQVGVAVSFILVVLVLLLHISILIWIYASLNPHNGIALAHEGNCSQIEKWSQWIHLLINLLSTLMLGASNYCMQRLSSPTRNDLDRAHAARRWLDIGVPSVRNLRSLDRRRVALWLIIGLSSAPLHLLYNSVVFENKGVTLPDIAFVTEDFFRGGSWLRNPKYDPAACRSNVIDLECFNDELIWLQNLTANNAYQNPKTFKKLSNAECIDTYGQAFTKDVDTLFVVIDSLAASDNNTVYGVSLTTWFSPFSGYFGMLENHKGSQLKNKTSGRSKRMLHYGSSGMPSNGPPSGGYTGTYTGTQTPPLNYTPVEPSVKMTKMGLQTSDWTGNPGVSWICGADDRTKRCNIKEQIKDAATWQIASYPISYCLSKIEPNQRCKLHFSSYILIAVTVANAAKALCMYLAFFRARAEPLVTLGDTIQSFLRDPDPHTKERCLWGKKDFKKYWHTDVDRPADDEAGVMIAEGSPNRWRPSSRFWFRAVSRWYYYIFIIFCLGGIVTCGLFGANNPVAEMLSNGLGHVNFSHVLGDSYPASWSIIEFVLVANSPQAAVSLYYLFYNSIWTSMLLGSEWSSYAQKNKFLRVSSPEGQQRQTYRLQIPYTYGIPLLIAMVLLHWLISQSLFLANTSYYARGQRIDTTHHETYPDFTIGVSGIGVFFAIILASAMVLALIINGWRQHSANIPLAGSCSAAISAACHAPLDDTDAALKAVGWGVVESGSPNTFGHCSYTARETEAPTEGDLYV